MLASVKPVLWEGKNVKTVGAVIGGLWEIRIHFFIDIMTDIYIYSSDFSADQTNLVKM